MVDNYNNYNENKIKIIDKYKLNNINYDYGDKIGLRQINKPININSNFVEINCDDDILEKLFIIYELNDDFEESNIEFLLDILSTSQISAYLNCTDELFKINLITSYFFCGYTDDDIIYINQEKLNNQISFGEFNQNEHKYCDMFGYLTEKNKYSNKLLIIPICTELFINLVPLRFLYGLKICYEKLNIITNTFIKNIHLSTQTINLQYLSRNHNYEKNELFFFSLPIMSNKVYCDNIDIGTDISSYQYTNLYSRHFDYLIIKLTPNYELIDKELWSESVEMLPIINFINYKSTQQYTVKFQPNDIALIRKSKKFHVYIFPGNPYLPLKSQINGVNKNKGNIIEIINKVYEDVSKGNGAVYMTNSYYFNYDNNEFGYNSNSNSEYSSDKYITFNIDTPIIPIIINVEEYRSNILDIQNMHGDYKVSIWNKN